MMKSGIFYPFWRLQLPGSSCAGSLAHQLQMQVTAQLDLSTEFCDAMKSINQSGLW
jgi:hypothetical protein